MIGVLVCLDYTCLLDNAEKNIRSKFYSIIAILAALDGILMNTSVAVFQSHGDDNHPSAHQLPCNSTDLNRLHKTTTIEERCGVNFGDFFQSDNGRDKYSEKLVILLTNSDIFTDVDPMVMSNQLNEQNLTVAIVPTRPRAIENDDRHRTLAYLIGGAYMGVDRFIDILPKAIHATLDGPYTLRQAFLQINSIQVQPQDIPSDGEPMTIPGDTANEQQARVDDLGDFFFEDGFSHTSDFN